MEYEMETDMFRLPKNRTRANFNAESPTINSGELNFGVDDNTGYQMTTNPTTDQASGYSQDSPVDSRIHRGGNRQYSGHDLIGRRRQRERNKVEFDVAGKEIFRSQYEFDTVESPQATDWTGLVNEREKVNRYRENSYRGNPHGRKSFRASHCNTQDDRKRHRGAARNPHTNLFNVEVYPINQEASIHIPLNQPMNQQVIQHMYQSRYPPMHQQVYNPMHPPLNPQINQWCAAQYPHNATTQQNVWSTTQSHPMISQQPIYLTTQPTFYGQPPISITQQDPGRANTYAVEIAISIFTIFFFFFPLGIAALCYAVKARELIRSGRFDEAKRRGQKAAILVIAALVLGIITYALFFAIYFFPPDS